MSEFGLNHAESFEVGDTRYWSLSLVHNGITAPIGRPVIYSERNNLFEQLTDDQVIELLSKLD